MAWDRPLWESVSWGRAGGFRKIIAGVRVKLGEYTSVKGRGFKRHSSKALLASGGDIADPLIRGVRRNSLEAQRMKPPAGSWDITCLAGWFQWFSPGEFGKNTE